jgi:hypothetical protein
LSSVTDVAYYTIQLTSDSPNVGNGGVNLVVSGITDADAVAILESWKSFAWPAAMGAVAVNVLKQEQVTTNYTTDYATTPVSFA